MSHKCKLCGKKFSDSNYRMFGPECFKKICRELDIEIPKTTKPKEREKYLCSVVANRLNKTELNARQKEYLTELYIATKYIDKINYTDLNKVKLAIENQIKKMNSFSQIALPNKDLYMLLYSMYNLYKATENYKNNIIEIEEAFRNSKIEENEKKDKKAINNFKYSFNVTKILAPNYYNLYYYKQYIFWNTVIIGGLLFKYKLAAKLLAHSLSAIGENPPTYNIVDEQFIEGIKKDKDFKAKLNEIIKQNRNKNYFKTDENVKEEISFEQNTDFKYALHNVSAIIEGNRNEANNWDLNVEIFDRFDFTDFIFLEEFSNKYKQINNTNKNIKQKAISSVKNGLGYTLNNWALVSVQCGLLKEFDVKINFKMENYNKEGE